MYRVFSECDIEEILSVCHNVRIKDTLSRKPSPPSKRIDESKKVSLKRNEKIFLYYIFGFTLCRKTEYDIQYSKEIQCILSFRLQLSPPSSRRFSLTHHTSARLLSSRPKRNCERACKLKCEDGFAGLSGYIFSRCFKSRHPQGWGALLHSPRR